MDLWGHDRKFGEGAEVIAAESIDSPNPVSLHSCDDLQVEYVSACYRMTAKQVHPPFNGACGNRQHMEKREQTRNGVQRIVRRTGTENAPRIGHDGIELAEYLRGYVKRGGGVARSF